MPWNHLIPFYYYVLCKAARSGHGDSYGDGHGDVVGDGAGDCVGDGDGLTNTEYGYGWPLI